MAESPNWAERLQEARQRTVFEPTPSGAVPYVATLESLAAQLDIVEVSITVSTPSSPGALLARAVGMILREMINGRMYERNLSARFETQPDRVTALCDRLDAFLAKQESSGG